MQNLGPFGPAPLLAVAVSGGADSTALALLTQAWAAPSGARIIALIVDHGLRTGSGADAELTRGRLAARGIDARILTLSGLSPGARLQENARNARHAVLGQAARAAGALFLLLGHHSADQSETVTMRARRGGGGLEGMAAFVARNDVVLLRPLLTIPPEMLRDFLRAENFQWVEDPANADPRFERVRVRLGGAAQPAEDPAGRQRREAEAAIFLARHAVIRPQGFAVIHTDTAPAAALGALLRVIGGNNYAPGRKAVTGLAERLRPATLGGVRIMPAGKLGPGWLLVREEAACAPPIAAGHGAIWDGRFRFTGPGTAAMLGALGADATRFRNGSNLPAAILRVLPCLRTAAETVCLRPPAYVFTPRGPLAPHPFIEGLNHAAEH